jgi:zinc transport system ATP-binding protein
MQVTPVVDVCGVTFDYGGVCALDDISLRVMPGDFLGIIGPNGSGKTTLLRVMLGLAEPTRGRVELFARPLRAFHEWRRIGYVPQRALLDPGLPVTVEEVVATGLVATRPWLSRRAQGERHRVIAVLDFVGMREHRAAPVARLSAGQQQRVLIARALVSEPELLVLDEPTGGVDAEAQMGFYAVLRHLNRVRGVTLVMVSHDVGVIAREVTSLACVNRRLLFCGRAGDVLNEPALTALYGGPVRLVGHEPPCPHAPGEA